LECARTGRLVAGVHFTGRVGGRVALHGWRHRHTHILTTALKHTETRVGELGRAIGGRCTLTRIGRLTGLTRARLTRIRGITHGATVTGRTRCSVKSTVGMDTTIGRTCILGTRIAVITINGFVGLRTLGVTPQSLLENAQPCIGIALIDAARRNIGGITYDWLSNLFAQPSHTGQRTHTQVGLFGCAVPVGLALTAAIGCHGIGDTPSPRTAVAGQTCVRNRWRTRSPIDLFVAVYTTAIEACVLGAGVVVITDDLRCCRTIERTVGDIAIHALTRVGLTLILVAFRIMYRVADDRITCGYAYAVGALV